VLVFDLPSAVEFADLQGGIDYNRAIVKSFDYGWVSFLENKLHCPRSEKKLQRDQQLFSARQCAQRLANLPNPSVCRKRSGWQELPIENVLLLKRQLGPSEVIPGSSWPV
jgi:hypothetical protein